MGLWSQGVMPPRSTEHQLSLNWTSCPYAIAHYQCFHTASRTPVPRHSSANRRMLGARAQSDSVLRSDRAHGLGARLGRRSLAWEHGKYREALMDAQMWSLLVAGVVLVGLLLASPFLWSRRRINRIQDPETREMAERAEEEAWRFRRNHPGDF
jgi:hypothetical protein